MLYGIGKDITSAKTMEEAVEMAGLDWTVEMKKLKVEDKFLPGYRANMVNDECLGIVSKHYKIVQNMEAFNFADGIANQLTFETAGSLYNNKKIWIGAKFKDVTSDGISFENYLVFTNSHDGKSSIRVSIIPVVNGNAINIPIEKYHRSWAVTHSGNVNKKMDEANKTLHFAEDYLQALVKQTNKMINTIMTEKQIAAFAETLFPINPLDGDRRIDNINEKRKSLISNIEAIQEHRGTAWQVLNGVSRLITNLQPSRSSDTFYDNKFGSIINGNYIIDQAYKLLKIKYISK